MSKNKKIIPLAIGVALLLAIIPVFFGSTEGSIVDMLKGQKSDSNRVKVEKIERKNNKYAVAKTIVKNNKNQKETNLTLEEAEKKAKDILEEFFMVTISNETPIKTEEIVDRVFETTLGNNDGNGSMYKVKIRKDGFLISANGVLTKESVSKNYEVDVDKSKELVEKFMKKHTEHLNSNINLTLTKSSNTQNNILNYKLQRVHNNINVVEEGGNIVVDAEKMKLISFNSTWSNIDFEEEVGKKLNKKEAINILKKSDRVSPIYINSGENYVLDFSLDTGDEYIIDVSKREVKSIFKDEYTVKGNVQGKIKNLNSEIKTKEEVEAVSKDIIKVLTGKEGTAKSTKIIEENGKRLIRSIIGAPLGERYYVEYDSKTFQVMNIYKYGYDTLEKSNFTPIEFNEAYKKAVESIGLIYNKELKNLDLNQREYDLSNSRVYNFTFNRLHNKLKVKDQYISVNVDAITGEVLSIFLEWKNQSKFDNSRKGDIEKAKESYLDSLKGEYVYINENGIGKLYYILKEKS